MRFWNRLGLAIAVLMAALAAMPSSAASAVALPTSGRIHSYVSADPRGFMTAFAADTANDFWNVHPHALNTTVSASAFDDLGTVAGSASVAATWTSVDAGAIAIDFQALLTATDGTTTSGGGLGAVKFYEPSPFSQDVWTYEFVASADSVFELDYAFDDTLSGRGLQTSTGNSGRLSVNGQYIELPSRPDTIGAVTYVLTAGRSYSVAVTPTIFLVSDATAVWTGAQRYSFTITAPTPPGGEDGGVPEPSAWALMIAGFGIVGAAMRRRRAPASGEPLADRGWRSPVEAAAAARQAWNLCGLLSLSLIGLAIAAPASAAGEVRLLYETRQDATQFDFSLHAWSSIEDLRNGVNETASAVHLNVSPAYQGVGLDIYQGKPYLLYESRNDLNDPNYVEVGVASSDSLDDLLSGVGVVNQSVNLNVPAFDQIAGFDIYQDKVYVLYESRVDVGRDFSLRSWDSLDDFLAGVNETVSSVNLNITPAYQAAGFDIYQGKPYLLYEARGTLPFSFEFGLASWDSIDDFVGGVGTRNDSVNLSLPSSLRVAGFDILDDPAGNSGVPEPATWALMLAGFGLVAGALRRRRAPPAARFVAPGALLGARRLVGRRGGRTPATIGAPSSSHHPANLSEERQVGLASGEQGDRYSCSARAARS